MKHQLQLGARWLLPCVLALAGPAFAQRIAHPVAHPVAQATVQTTDDVRRLADLPYGPDARQRMDVYLPAPAHGAPVLVMVHGGAWMFGDKAAASVVDPKVEHWVHEQGFILVSVGYRLVPQVDVMQQAQDVARALASVQASAASWGGDAALVVLMGHSAGAHLVALLAASPDIARQQGARPWLGTVALDSAALDTAALMQRRHMAFYDRVFGSEPAFWRSVSPTDALAAGTRPMLLVCASQRRDGSCTQAQQFAARIASTGGRAQVLPQDLSHAEVNAELGLSGGYTAAVDAFMRSVGALGAPGRWGVHRVRLVTLGRDRGPWLRALVAGPGCEPWWRASTSGFHVRPADPPTRLALHPPGARPSA